MICAMCDVSVLFDKYDMNHPCDEYEKYTTYNMSGMYV